MSRGITPRWIKPSRSVVISNARSGTAPVTSSALPLFSRNFHFEIPTQPRTGAGQFANANFLPKFESKGVSWRPKVSILLILALAPEN